MPAWHSIAGWIQMRLVLVGFMTKSWMPSVTCYSNDHFVCAKIAKKNVHIYFFPLIFSKRFYRFFHASASFLYAPWYLRCMKLEILFMSPWNAGLNGYCRCRIAVMFKYWPRTCFVLRYRHKTATSSSMTLFFFLPTSLMCTGLYVSYLFVSKY